MSRVATHIADNSSKGGTNDKLNLKRVLLQLNVSDVQEILRIDMDEDAGAALAFVKNRLAKQVRGCLQPG